VTRLPTFLKKCPNCGKRFEVERVAESESAKEEDVLSETAVSESRDAVGPASPISVTENMQLPTSSGAHLDVEVEDEKIESFKCKHCGYTWTEKHEKMNDLGQVKGAGPDL
jgi:predicted RNA-binding Zn-ribbon protein involved in translation (DUF1610 family)